MEKIIVAFIMNLLLFEKAIAYSEKEIKFTHFKSQKNACFICHQNNNFREIHLRTGERVLKKDSNQICILCHGIVGRDYEIGAHGIKFKKLNCIDCHNPHHPQFKKMKAYKAPIRPYLGIKKE